MIERDGDGMAGIDVGGCCEDLVPVAAGGQVMVWGWGWGWGWLEGRLACWLRGALGMLSTRTLSVL